MLLHVFSSLTFPFFVKHEYHDTILLVFADTKNLLFEQKRYLIEKEASE